MSLDAQITTREQKKFVLTNDATAVRVFNARGSFQAIPFIIESILGDSSFDSVVVEQTSNLENLSFYNGVTLVKQIQISYINETDYVIADASVLSDFLLLEDGDNILLENGSKILLD